MTPDQHELQYFPFYNQPSPVLQVPTLEIVSPQAVKLEDRYVDLSSQQAIILNSLIAFRTSQLAYRHFSEHGYPKMLSRVRTTNKFREDMHFLMDNLRYDDQPMIQSPGERNQRVYFLDPQVLVLRSAWYENL